MQLNDDIILQPHVFAMKHVSLFVIKRINCHYWGVTFY